MENIYRINEWNGDCYTNLITIRADIEAEIIKNLKREADKLWNDDNYDEHDDWNDIFKSLLVKNKIDFQEIDILEINC